MNISVACLGHRVLKVLLNNGSTLNVCPLATTIALGFSPSNFGLSTQIVRVYDGTQRTIMGTITAHVMIKPVRYLVLFQVLKIQSSFNLLLGRPWIHEAGAIPSSIYQKLKFIHEGRVISIQSNRDVITSAEPVLQIGHKDDDLYLTGFTFDEVRVVSLEDDSRNSMPMLFDQYSSTLVLSMMRDMSYLPGLGLGRRQQGPHEFAFIVSHDAPYSLSYTPIEEDAPHMVRLRMDRVKAHLSGIPFDYPLHPYTFRLADYFIRGSEHVPRVEGIDHISETGDIQDIQQALGHMHLSSKIIEGSDAVIVAPSSPSRANMFSMCFSDEDFDFGLLVEFGDGADGVTFDDAYTDEMDMIGIGRILDTTPHKSYSTFGVSMLEMDGDDSITDVAIPSFISIEGASNLVDPPLSFDFMFEFVTHYDVMFDGNNNDMSLFEYLSVS